MLTSSQHRMFRWALVSLLWVAGESWGVLEVAEPPPPVAGDLRQEQPVPASASRSVHSDLDGDLLKFDNGDSLHGVILGVGADNVLQWRRADVKDSFGFSLDNVQELQLAPRPPRTLRTPHRLVVELTNGDRLAGDLVALNDKVLKLSTWYAGVLSLKRNMVQRIICVAAPPEALYSGPTGLSGWTVSNSPREGWKFKNGAFYSPFRGGGSIGCNVNLPDMANIEFDIAWRGQLACQVGFYYEGLRQLYGSGGYALQLNGSSVFLNRCTANSMNSMGNNADVPKLQIRNKAHVSIRVNKAKKTIALLVDNELVKPWTDPETFAGSGQGLIFNAQGQGQFRLSSIRVTAWDGRLDSGTIATLAASEDVVRFGNNDKVSGAIKSINQGEVVVATSFMEMKVPLERVAQIDFADQKIEKPHRQAGDIRAIFLDGSRFTMALEKLTDQALTGSCESCGHVTTALDAFSRIQFRIYAVRPAASAENGWGDGGDGDNTEGKEL